MCYETAEMVKVIFQGTHVTGFKRPYKENLYAYYEFLSTYMH